MAMDLLNSLIINADASRSIQSERHNVRAVFILGARQPKLTQFDIVHRAVNMCRQIGSTSCLPAALLDYRRSTLGNARTQWLQWDHPRLY